MSLCRPLITQVHAPKLPHCQLTPISLRSGTSAAARVNSTRHNARVSGSVRVHHPSRLFAATSYPLSSHPTHPSKALSASLETFPDKDAPITLAEYEQRRHHDRTSIAHLSDSSYLSVLSHALENGLNTLADCVALDILEVFRGSSSRQESLLREILSLNFAGLGRDILLRMLEHLHNTPNGLKSLTTRNMESLIRLILQDLHMRDADRALAELIHPRLVECVAHFRASGGVRSVDYHPPGIIFAAFSMVHKLLALSLQQQGLELFGCLVKLRHIPPEAIQDTDSSSDDFNTIISKTLIRASLHWNWRTLANALIRDMLDSTSAPRSDILELNTDVIYALLDTPSRQDIRACGHLIYRVHKHAPVPNSIIRQFYDRAAEKLATDEAVALYSFTRSYSVLQTHHYPPPQGLSLTWLMVHLASASHKTYLSRVLASEVLTDNLSIPLQHRAKFIATTAAQGYGTLARKLWERYAVGKDKEFIIGDCTLMIRMVSLFANLSKRANVRYEAALTGSSPNPEILKGHVEDLNTFVHRILSEFTTYHRPLTEAAHHVLTSLARANFILGKFADGLKCFSFLARRKELPDLHDVNVLLSALARVSPRLAVKMTKRMEARGLRPDAVTFGTILHNALLHQDEALVPEMIRRIHSLPDKRITLKTMVGLIRASIVSVADDSNADKRKKLGTALLLIKSFPQTNIQASPQMGKYLVYRSLEAEDGELAYQFWKLCLRDSTEWHDREQQLLRGSITRMIKNYSWRFESQQVADMLSQLRVL